MEPKVPPDSGSNVIPFSVPSVKNDTRVDAFGLFTGQVGYAANNVLFYLKGGAAVTSDRYRMLTTASGAPVANNVDDTRWGGVVGVGLEYGFAPNWSAGIEYNHMFMQDKTYSFVSNGASSRLACRWPRAASVRTLISSPLASTTSSAGTDLRVT